MERPKLVDATIPELLEHLKAPEEWTRQQAKRVLKERGAGGGAAGVGGVGEATRPEGSGRRASLLEALWVCECARSSTTPEMLERPASQSPYGTSMLTAAARRRARDWQSAHVATDCRRSHRRCVLNRARSTSRVRLEAVRALARSTKRRTRSRRRCRPSTSRWTASLDYALWLTVRELEPYWMPEFQAGKLTFGGDAKKLAFALNAVGNKDTVKPVVALIDAGKVPKENLHGLYLLLAQIGGPEESAKVLDVRRAPTHGDGPNARNSLEAVEEAVRMRKVGPPGDAAELLALLGRSTPDSALSCRGMRLAGLWKVEACAGACRDAIARSTASLPADRGRGARRPRPVRRRESRETSSPALCDAEPNAGRFAGSRSPRSRPSTCRRGDEGRGVPRLGRAGAGTARPVRRVPQPQGRARRRWPRRSRQEAQPRMSPSSA